MTLTTILMFLTGLSLGMGIVGYRLVNVLIQLLIGEIKVDVIEGNNE